MKNITEKLQSNFDHLAEALVTPGRYSKLGKLSLAEDVTASFPPHLRLLEPPESGWEITPPEAA